MMRWTGFARLTAALLTACLAACGGSGGSGDGGDAAAGGADPNAVGTPVTQTVGAAGGTVSATTLGVKVTLTFPEGALAADTAITVTPLAPAAGDSVSLRVAPDGLFFAQPVTLVLEYPATAVPDRNATLRQRVESDDVFVATTVDTATRTLTARLGTFGGPVLKTLGPASENRRTALHAGVAADPPPDDGGTLSVSQIAGIDVLVGASQRRLDALIADAKFGQAYALQLSLAALLQRSGQDGYLAQAQPFLVAARDSACSARNRAIASAQAATISKAGDWKQLAEPILYWESAAERVGGEPCTGPGAGDAINDITAREFALQKDHLLAATKPADYGQPSAEVKDARDVIASLKALQRTDAAAPAIPQAVGRPRALALNLGGFVAAVQEGFVDPMLVPARNAAWNTAKETGALGQYQPLLEGFGPQPLLLQDVQYQRTAATLVSVDDTGYVVNRVKAGIEGSPDLPVDPVKSVDMAMRAGSLTLTGSIAALQCPTPASETLTVTFEGVEVARVDSRGDMLLSNGSPLPTFTAAGLLAAAGLAPTDTGRHTLRVRRTGSACATQFGLADDVLITVNLDFGAPQPPLQKFERCYYVVGNVLPAPDQRVDTWEIARNGDGTAALIPRNLDSSFALDNVIYPVWRWPSEATRLVDARIDVYGTPTILNLAFTVDAQGRRHLDGTIQVDPAYDPGAGPATVSATCRNDLP